MRELEFMSGILASVVSSMALKDIIKEPRPVPSDSYGMPSTRATVVTFIVMYLLKNKQLTKRERGLIIAIGGALIYMKYHSRKHSITQLIAGGALGALIMSAITSPSMPWAQRTP